MLLYEYRVRDEFTRLREYAQNIRAKFERETDPSDLLLDARNLKALYTHLDSMLPEEVQGRSNLGRHISFMESWLVKDSRHGCQGDITDICERDITELENAFQSWCKNPDHYDSELAVAIADLVATHQLDSAIRKSFVVLKERLCIRFQASRDLDGPELVNTIFGKKSNVVKNLAEHERQAMRDLLCGMYGVFRNRFAHSDAEPKFAEADAIISMVNHILQKVSRM